ncbi:hypothetical protein AAGG74_16235 [Bacillus mexicanus]|uniref:hypothetical protein n=1 Tax=Bacillus mexicanus TaxID=2834415 RepID=UPI003D211311
MPRLMTEKDKANYVNQLTQMTKSDLISETKINIQNAAWSNSLTLDNDDHWKAEVCASEFQRRNDNTGYKIAHERAMKN